MMLPAFQDTVYVQMLSPARQKKLTKRSPKLRCRIMVQSDVRFGSLAMAAIVATFPTSDSSDISASVIARIVACGH
jgi:hypothetical protein